MVLQETQEQQEIELIYSDHWELPVCNLGDGKYTWRPKTAFLPYFLFEGPKLSRRSHGISLEKDLLIGVHGPRGSSKTLTLSYLLAKKMRMGQPVWANWPISFYVIEPSCWDVCDKHSCHKCREGNKTYYENYPLNFDKLYTFNSEISNGAVGLTELQYYAEARTSGRQQNRFLSYQIIQIRKSALSFLYDVQNPNWSDKRFSWSDDTKIFCRDVSKMNYDFASVGHELEEGEFCHWMIRDISGVSTGIMYDESQQEYGPFQFWGYPFWLIYPTKWKIDVYDAVYSMKQQSEKADQDAVIGKAIANALNALLDGGKLEVMVREVEQVAFQQSGLTISPVTIGRILSAYDIPSRVSGKKGTRGKLIYDLSVLLEEEEAETERGKR